MVSFVYNCRTLKCKYGSNQTGLIHRRQWRSFHLQSHFVFYFKQFELHQNQPSFQTSLHLHVFRMYFRQQSMQQQQQPPQTGSEETHSILHPPHLVEAEPEHSDYAAPRPINQVKKHVCPTPASFRKDLVDMAYFLKQKKIQCLKFGKWSMERWTFSEGVEQRLECKSRCLCLGGCWHFTHLLQHTTLERWWHIHCSPATYWVQNIYILGESGGWGGNADNQSPKGPF